MIKDSVFPFLEVGKYREAEAKFDQLLEIHLLEIKTQSLL